MGLFGMMGDSFGCSATGERLVSAARDGDFQEAKAILEYNPRLAKYSTFGVRNSPLHYSASQGHHEIVSLLIESGVDMNLRNYRGQTALMQACLCGHWKVVQTLILFKANIYKKDFLSGGTALHFASLNGHSRCIRLLLADHIPSISEFYNIMRTKSQDDPTSQALSKVINRKADGGITALHLAALNGNAESVQLLLDLGADLSEVTVEDGSTIDLIGAGSTALHYAACGGNVLCCQLIESWVHELGMGINPPHIVNSGVVLGLLIASGASLTAQNGNGLTPLMVARSWHKNGLEGILSKQPETRIRVLPSSFLSLPLMSIFKIARECGWRRPIQSSPSCVDQCVICLETKCMVSAQGCNHEFCVKCALYLCSTTTAATSARAQPGSIPCPLCRNPIISFNRLLTTTPRKLQLPFKTTNNYNNTPHVLTMGPTTRLKSNDWSVDLGCGTTMKSLSFRKLKMKPLLCDGFDNTNSCLIKSCMRAELQRSASGSESVIRRRRILNSP